MTPSGRTGSRQWGWESERDHLAVEPALLLFSAVVGEWVWGWMRVWGSRSSAPWVSRRLCSSRVPSWHPSEGKRFL